MADLTITASPAGNGGGGRMGTLQEPSIAEIGNKLLSKQLAQSEAKVASATAKAAEAEAKGAAAEKSQAEVSALPHFLFPWGSSENPPLV